MHNPHIGIVGVTQAQQVTAAIETLEGLPSATRRPLAITIHARRETLEQGSNLSPSKYPDASRLRQLLVRHEEVQYFIRYTTDRPDDLAGQLDTFLGMYGAKFHGFQLGMAWPDPAQIRIPRTLRCVLEIGQKAVKDVGRLEGMTSEDLVARRIKKLGHYVDGVLICGDIPLSDDSPNNQPVAEMVRAISTTRPDLNIGIACELAVNEIRKRAHLARTFPNLNLDLEWIPRDADDQMSISTMQKCIVAADALFNG